MTQKYNRSTARPQARHAASRSAAARPASNVRRKAPARKKKPCWLLNQLRQRPLPVWIIAVTDILLIGIALVIFALFHHVIPAKQESTGIVSSRENMVAIQTAVPEETPAPTAAPVQQAAATAAPAAAVPEATEAPDPVGYFGNKYAKRFNADGSVQKDDTSYVSGNVNIKIREFEEYSSEIYFADIYIKDISCLQTVFGEGTYGRSYNELVKDMARDADAILAINGDYYGTREEGVVIRNGELYRDKDVDGEVCVIFWDGSMEIYDKKEFDAEAVMAAGAYQAWTFGPSLLDDNGMPIEDLEDGYMGGIAGKNPRAVLGYFQPGHYAFVVVDGRTDDSRGITLDDLAKLMESLGCKKAYNMDGGNSAVMFFDGSNHSNPSKGGRGVSDAIIIVDGAE